MLLPQLFKKLTSTKPPVEVVYLCIKFLWKIVHYEVQFASLVMVAEWTPLLLKMLGAFKPELHSGLEETQAHGIGDFYCFHSKKWALKIFHKLVSKHLKATQKDPEEKHSFVKKWYGLFGEALAKSTIEQFKHCSPKKVRFFELRVLLVLVYNRPELVDGYSSYFQYEQLLPFLKLKPEDERLASENVIEYINKEDEASAMCGNLKKCATEVWLAFAEMGSKLGSLSEKYQEGKHLGENMEFLELRLEGRDLIEK